jgi:hypothetical protein
MTHRRVLQRDSNFAASEKDNLIKLKKCFFSLKNYHPIPRRDSISRPIAPISEVSNMLPLDQAARAFNYFH